MRISSRNLKDEVSNFLDYLLESEIALLVQPVALLSLPEGGARVTWSPYKAAESFLVDRERIHSLAGYRDWLNRGAYSAMLFDGALLQITVDVAGGAIVGHRLAYLPCPFEIDSEWLQTESALDLVDAYENDGVRSVALRSAVRFDYDPVAAKPGHPAAHMTLNSVHCRVACSAPLRIGHFVDFVFSNFYPELWFAHRYLRELSRSDYGPRTISAEEAQRIHLHWQPALAS